MTTIPQKISRPMLVLMIFLFASFAALAQGSVTGKITDSTGAPVANATVSVKGSKIAVRTNNDGSFTVNAPASSTLVVSSVGFSNQEIALNGRNSVNVSMLQNTSALNEVVVVAYGTRRRGDLTGSVTAITAKDFQKGFIPSPEQLLQGKVAGLQITSGGGSAGGGSRIRIRGGASLNSTNDPLIVIDGVPVEVGNGISGSGNLLSTINSNDIESISVLKDASATSLYGSRASNGVIIITTKKGVRGKVRYNFNTQLSVSDVTKYVDVLSADQVRNVINADATATGSNTYKSLLGTANTNWQDAIYRKAIGFDNNISASGAIGALPFRASLGYLNQEGVLLKNKFDRYSAALNLSPKLFNSHLAVNVNARYSTIKNNFSDQGAVGAAVNFDPTQPIKSSNKFGGYFEWLQADGNPISLANRNPLALINLRDNKSTVNRFIGNVALDYKVHFLPDLHVLLNLGADETKGEGNDNIDSLSATNYKTGGRKVHYEQQKHNSIADIQLFYVKELKNLNTKFDILVGHSFQKFTTDVSNFSAFSYRKFSNPNNLALKDTIELSQPTFLSDKIENALESYIGRINLNVSEKYLLTANLRRDASSRISPDFRVSYFPSVAFAWKLKEEFFRTSSVLTDLKVRVSYGETGQQEGLSSYSYINRYSVGNSAVQYQFGNTFYTPYRPEGYDKSLKWESTATTNIGLDFGMWDNRVSGTLDLYQKKTTDLLSEVPLAPGANFINSFTTNVGNMDVRGLEFSLNTTPVKTSNTTWDFGFNISYNEREITRLLSYEDPNFKGINVGGIGIATGNFIAKNSVGSAPNTFFVYKQIYDKNNKPIEGLYEDMNRDGTITSEDRYLYKQPNADVTFGWNTQLMYKKLSIGVTAHGSLGNYLYNQYQAGSGILAVLKNPVNFIGNASTSYLETGFHNNSENQFLSDYFIQNASFMRIDNLNLGYMVGSIFKNKANMRISASIQNLAIITKYKGLDPENSSDFGIDGNIYPRPRIYSLGINLDF